MYKKNIVFKKFEASVMSLEDQVTHGLNLPIDQMPVKSFNINPFGHPRNVVSQLAHCASLEEYQAIARNLSRNPAQYALKEGFKAKDVFAQLKPRSCQMPTELEDFAEALKPYDMQRIEEAYKKAVQPRLFGKEKNNETAAPAAPAAPAAAASAASAATAAAATVSQP